MARRKPPKPSSAPQSGLPKTGPSSANAASSNHADGRSVEKPKRQGSSETSASLPVVTHAQVPSPAVMWVVSVAVVAHLFALFLSFSAIIEPSSTHAKGLAALAPYLRVTHFAADGRPYYLAHATADEQPHRLQIATGGGPDFTINPQTEWTTVAPAGTVGLAAWDRYSRWMKLASTLAESEQPSLAAALLEPLVSSDPTIRGVRIIRLPTELSSTTDFEAKPVYVARVVRSPESVQLVSVQSPRLTTFPRSDDAASEENAP